MDTLIRKTSCRGSVCLIVATTVLFGGCVSTLESAVEDGDYEAARRAIAHGASVDGNYWISIKEPMYRAVENDDLEMLKLLHTSGAKLLPDLLSEAAQATALSTYDYLVANGIPVDECHLDVDYPSFWTTFLPSNTMPPLGSAVIRGNRQSIEALLRHGAPVEQVCTLSSGGAYEFSAIINAAYYGDPAVIRLLIQAGASPNRLFKGDTPLSIVAKRGHYDAARVLLANGAFHSYSEDIKQPVEHAIEGGHNNIVELLVQAGAVRPRQVRSSEIFENVVDGLVVGAIIVGTVVLLAEGTKYYAYSEDKTSDVAFDSTGRAINQLFSQHSEGTRQSDDDDKCRSDFDCSGLEVCKKSSLGSDGVCVLDTRRKMDRDYNALESALDSSAYRDSPKDCPLGTSWDSIYEACLD